MPRPDELREHFVRAIRLQEEGRVADAEAIFRGLLEIDNAPMIRVLLATLLPQIYTSADHVKTCREQCLQRIEELHRQGFTMDLTGSLAVPWFSLAYQGLNDRDAQRSLARLYRAPIQPPVPVLTPRRDKRIRVGFISPYFKDHTIGHLTRGLVATLNRDDFYVTTFSAGRYDDDIARFIQGHADAHIDLPQDLTQARRIIAGQKQDILYFTDLAMEPVTYTLAATRYAPVQCMTWGHPDTTGLETVDYFISSEALDTADGQNYYNEKLVRPPRMAVYYYRPKLPQSPAAPTPAQFGLPEGHNFYGCLQTLIKLHPHFDAIIREILTRDPKGILVLLKGNRPTWNDLIMSRWAETLPGLTDRIRFVERQKREAFFQLNSICDVMLDPIHFGGGNTTYEALALGVPVVTLPSPFLRGRITYAMYQSMGMNDCVATSPKEYVERAVKLGTDKAYRRTIHQKIVEKSPALFEDAGTVRDLESFFKEAVKKAAATATA